MSEIVSVSDDVTDLVKEIILKHDLDPNSEVIYGVGSKFGDGFMSKTAAVDIINDNKHLYLFVKYALNVESNIVPLDIFYATEKHFFNVIYPDYLKFIESRDVKDALDGVPKCYGTSEKNVIALENLKKKSFEMIDPKKPMNENHISAVFKAMGRFSAICFAFKDHNKDRYEEITGSLTNFRDDMEKMFEFAQRPLYNRFFDQLDPVTDKSLLDRREDIYAKVIEYFRTTAHVTNKYSILNKGDFWSNNIMFRYENEDRGSPVDTVLVDWQAVNVDSVVKDLSNFFYSSAGKEDLRKFKDYLKIYHDELSTYMKKLGSDPENIFPFSALEEEWRQHNRYGYGTAIAFLFNMVCPRPEITDMEAIHADKKNMENIFFQAELCPEYMRRFKDLTEFCIENDFI